MGIGNIGKRYPLHQRHVDGDSSGTGGFEAGKPTKASPERTRGLSDDKSKQDKTKNQRDPNEGRSGQMESGKPKKETDTPR